MKVGVIGAGSMGGNHARIAAQATDYELGLVFDSDETRADRLAQRFTAKIARSVDELIENVDAVIIATPTDTHAFLMRKCLDFRKPFLVEKPVAAQTSDIDDELLENRSLVMAVGHVERFNPAIRYVRQLNLGRINAISARREGPYSNRISEGVTRDLMIHDIDLANYLLDEQITVRGASLHASKSETEDVSSAVLQSRTGTVVSLFASRIGQTKVRDIRIVTDEFLAVLDLLQRTVVLYKQGASEFIGSDSPVYSEQLTVETPMLSNFAEPLAAEQAAFVNSVKTGQFDKELATVQQGLYALQIANEISGQNRPQNG
jgi:predicted dehydrogenase